MDFTLLKTRPTGPHVGGALNKVYFALKSWFVDETIPDRDAGNKAVISNNCVFKTGKGWELMYVTKYKQKLVEEANEERDNDNVKKTFTGFHPGMKEAFRQFVSENGGEEMFLLVFDCAEPYPFLFGDKCSGAIMNANVDSGEQGGVKGNTLTVITEGAYYTPIYKGSFVSSDTIIAADDATPDVSVGSQFITSANAGATDITDLDNPNVGSTITITGGSNTNSSTITNAGNFSLTAAMTLSLGAFITLFVRADNDYVELARG